MTRKELLLEKIDLKKDRGLELGPLCWPLIAKDEAAVKYVDHATTRELKKIYQHDDGVDLGAIVDVDYALRGRSLHETVGDTEKFDYIVASHVIEHVPDMVDWFKDLYSVLKPGGIVALAIPDKRYTFDIDRRISELSDVVGAFLDKHTRTPSAAMFDFASNFRQGIDAGSVWKGDLSLQAPHRYSLAQSYDMCLEGKRTYVDAHCFVFTPWSFLSLVHGLTELNLLDFTVASFHETAEGQYEFIVSLQKTAEATSRTRRLKALPKIVEPLREREQLARIAQLQHEVSELRGELDGMLGSRSWKLTKPLRSSLRYAKKLGRNNPGVH